MKHLLKIKKYALGKRLVCVQVLIRPATWLGWLGGYKLLLATTDPVEGEAFYQSLQTKMYAN